MYKKWFELGLNSKIGNGEFFEYIINIAYATTLKAGDVAIDGGANRGRHTLPMSKAVSDDGLIIGFEAIPNLAEKLISTLADSSIHNVKIVSKAIGEHIGITEFNYVVNLDGFSGIRERNGIPEGMRSSIAKLSVSLTTIDAEVEVLAANRRVRFMKLDLEGGEYHALRGASKVMNEHDPLIVFENGRQLSADVYDYDIDSWFQLFDVAGYQVFDLFGRRFTKDLWSAPQIPWYFIAAKRPEDLVFVERNLPNLIEVLEIPSAKII